MYNVVLLAFVHLNMIEIVIVYIDSATVDLIDNDGNACYDVTQALLKNGLLKIMNDKLDLPFSGLDAQVL